MPREYLPGDPPPKLLREVRKALRGYGVRPKNPQWRAMWEWANKIRNSYYDPRWPRVAELVAQYTVLVLAEMRDDFMLKLPHRAISHITPAASVMLATPGPAAISGNPAKPAEAQLAIDFGSV